MIHQIFKIRGKVTREIQRKELSKQSSMSFTCICLQIMQSKVIVISFHQIN